jgi:hypothetical protein
LEFEINKNTKFDVIPAAVTTELAAVGAVCARALSAYSGVATVASSLPHPSARQIFWTGSRPHSSCVEAETSLDSVFR